MDNTKGRQGYESLEHLPIAGGNIKLFTHYIEKKFSIKINITLLDDYTIPYDLEVISVVLIQENKTCQTRICIQMFIAAFFVITSN